MAHVHLCKQSRASNFVESSNTLQFIQYILLTPTYINVLNIYAFCNTHDITWGTKGDDKAEKLPSAHLKPGGKVDVNIPQDDGDLNAQYEAELEKFAMKPPKEIAVVSEEEKQADYYKGFRSAVVLAWVFCNFALGAVVLSAAGLETFNDSSKTSSEDEETKRSMIYMKVVLWSVAGLSIFKFVGAMWYLVVRMVSTSFLREDFGQSYANIHILVPRRLIQRTLSVTIVFLDAMQQCYAFIYPLILSGFGLGYDTTAGPVWYENGNGNVMYLMISLRYAFHPFDVWNDMISLFIWIWSFFILRFGASFACMPLHLYTCAHGFCVLHGWESMYSICRYGVLIYSFLRVFKYWMISKVIHRN